MRTTFAWLACSLIACSEDAPQTHGPNLKPDAGADTSAAPDTSVPVDATADQSVADVGTDAPSCTSTTALLAGNASTLWGGSATGKAAITTATVAGNTSDRIAIAPVGSGFVAALRASGNVITSTVFTNSWADTAAVPNATTLDAPALATIGSVAHLVYQDAAFKYEHRKYVASTWDVSDDPVGGSGSNQSFGAKAPAATGAGTDLVVLQGGSDALLYDQTWSGSSWVKAHQQANMSVENTVTPTIITLSNGDLLAVYLRKADFKIMSSARTSATWEVNPMLLDATAYTNDPVALTALGGGRALLVYRGSNTQPYFSVYDPKKTPAWTVPAPLLPSNPMIASTPSVALGVCGDDAIVAYAKVGGGVELAHFSGGTFAGPDLVMGTTGATQAAISTR